MKNQSFKFLFVLLVIVCIIVVGWAAIYKTKTPSTVADLLISKDVLVYAVSENDNISFYKAAMNGTSPIRFYSLPKYEKTGQKIENNEVALPWSSSIINDYLVLRVFSGEGNNIIKQRVITLNGTEVTETPLPTKSLFFDRAVASVDGTVKASVESKNSQKNIIINGPDVNLSFSIKKFPREFADPESRILFLQFAPDNKSLFVGVDIFVGDIGGPQGLYQLDLQTQKLKEVSYSDTKDDIEGKEYKMFLTLDSNAENAYFWEDLSQRRLVQLNLKTGKKRELYPSTLSFETSFDSKGTMVFLSPLFGAGTKMISGTLPDGDMRELPISGNYRAITSDNHYLVYEKSYEVISSTPIATTKIPNINEAWYTIRHTELHVFNMTTGRDVLIFDDQGTIDGEAVGGKGYSFVGLVTAN